MARTDRRGKGSANQTAQTSFTGGEISPRTRGRIEHDLYDVSLKEALNTVIHPQGPISSRTGTEFIENLSVPVMDGQSEYALFSFEGPVGDTYTLAFRPAENYGSRAIVIRHIEGLSLLVHQPWSFNLDAGPSPARDDQTHIASQVSAANPGVVTMSMPFFASDNSYVYTRKQSASPGHSLLEDGRLKCNVIAKAGTSNTEASASSAWRLFPLEIPVAQRSHFTADVGFGDATGSGNVLGTYLRIVPTDGNVANVPEPFRWLLNGYYFCDSKDGASGAGRIRLRRMGILGPQAPEQDSADTGFTDTKYKNGDAGLIDASFMAGEFTAGTYPEFTPKASALNLSLQALEESKFTLTGHNTSTGGASATDDNTVEVYKASEVFVPVPISDLKDAHVAQNLTSLVFAGENFAPFELFFSQYPTMCSGGDEPVVDVTSETSPQLTHLLGTETGRYGLGLGIAGHFEYYPIQTEKMSVETYTPHLGAGIDAKNFYAINYPHYVRAPAQLTQHIADADVNNLGDKLEFAFYVTGTDRTTGVESFGARIDCRQDALIGANAASHIDLKFWLNGENQNQFTVYMYEGISQRMLYVKGLSQADGFRAEVKLSDQSPNSIINESTPWGDPTILSISGDEIRSVPENAEFAKRGPHQVTNPFNGAGNYPSSVSFSGQRLAFGGSKNSAETVWLSGIDRFTDFTATDAFDEESRPLLDTIRQDSAIKIAGTSQSVSKIMGLAAMQELIAFTRKAENRIGAGDFATLTPGTAGVYPQSGYGSTHLQPIQAEDSALYVTQSGSAIRDLQYAADGLAGAAYGGKDLSILVRHFFEGRKVVDWTYARPPESLLYVVLDDGTALTATYNPEHEVIAWSKYNTDGNFLAVSSSPDERAGSIVTAIVERFSALGERVITAEKFSPGAEYNDDQRHIALDSAVAIYKQPQISEQVYITEVMHFPATAFSGDGEVWVKFAAESSFGRPIRQVFRNPSGTADPITIEGFTSANGGTLVPGGGNTINGLKYVQWLQAEGSYLSSWARLVTNQGASTRYLVTPAPSSAIGYAVSDPSIKAYARKIDAGGVTSITAPHLANRSDITLVKDGVASTVSADGAGTISLGGTTFEAIVGLGFTARIRTLPFTDFRRGTIKGNPKRVSRVTLSLLDSRGAQVGMGDGPLVDIKDPLDESGLDAGRLRSGDRNVSIRGTYDYYGEVVIEQSQPYPLTLLGIFSEMNVGEL
jgi:hypothetical protein